MTRKIVTVDAELAGLMPGYLQGRRAEASLILELLERGDFQELKSIGHKLRGSGGGFGLDFLTDLGRRIEESGSAFDGPAVAAEAVELAEYLECLEIRYSP